MDPLLDHPPSTIYDHIRTRVIVIHDGAMLLIPPIRGGDAWVSPGGGLEPGESLAECAVREVLEETGIRVRVEHIAFLQEWISVPQREAGTDYDLHIFFYATPVGDPVPRPESPGLPTPQWVPLQNVSTLSLHPAELKFLAAAMVRGDDLSMTRLVRGVFEDSNAPPRPLE